MHTRIESLDLVEAACWRELVRASRERDHAWRVMTLATVNGDHAEARSIVLRDVRVDERQLVFYTDERSPKVAQMAAHPNGTVLAWSSKLSWQLRLHVRLVREDDGLEVSSRWARMKLSPAAQDYLSPLAPGMPLGRNGPELATREHFAVITAQVQAIDWTELHADGHRRAQFDSTGPRWVQP